MATTTTQSQKSGRPAEQAPSLRSGQAHSVRSGQVQAPRPAGFFSRLEALVVDLVILSLIQLLGSVFIKIILRFFQLYDLAESLQALWKNSTYNLLGNSLLMTLVVVGYFTFFWTLVGFTPGKALLGLKVVRKDGAKVSFGRSLLRFFAYFISAIFLFLGFLWILWDPKRRGWHDKIAGTQVLYIPRKPHA
jgi:uncharacterized RDD family membrane protein YckC